MLSKSMALLFKTELNKKELLTFMPGSFSMSGRQQTGTGTGTLAPILDDEVESSEVGVEATDPEP